MAYSLGRAPASLSRQAATNSRVQPVSAGRDQLLRPTGRLIRSPRARLRLALFICIGLAGVFAFVVFPPRRVSVSADGREQVLVSRGADPAALLKQAGVPRSQNDVVVRDGNDLHVERALPVVLDVDGRTLAWRSRAQTVRQLLSEMDLQAGPYDAIYVNGIEASRDDSLATGAMTVLPPALMAAFGRTAPNTQGLAITLYRAVPFTVVEDNKALAFKSSRPTVALALKEAGIKLGPADLVHPAPEEALTAGQQISVKHAAAISIRLGDSSRLVYTQKAVLRDALAESGLSLGPDDRVEPGLDSRVENGMTARLVRVAGKATFEREEIIHKTVFKPDENLHGSASRVAQGRDGVRVREFRIVIEDGVETERKLIKDSFDPEPQDTVIYYAAGDVYATGLTTESMTVNRTMKMYVTWYDAASSGKVNTDRSYGITASGVPVTKGIVAVDPRVIPLGTRLFIPGYGFAVAGDTGGAVNGNVIDLGYPDGVVPDFKTGNYDVYILSS